MKPLAKKRLDAVIAAVESGDRSKVRGIVRGLRESAHYGGVREGYAFAMREVVARLRAGVPVERLEEWADAAVRRYEEAVGEEGRL